MNDDDDNVVSKAKEYNVFQSVARSGYIFKILAFAVAGVCVNGEMHCTLS